MRLPDERECVRCGLVKPISAFRSTRGGSSRAHRCEQCQWARRKVLRSQNDIDAQTANQKRWKALNQDKHAQHKELEHYNRRKIGRSGVGARKVANAIIKANIKRAAKEARAARIAARPWTDSTVSGSLRWRMRYELDVQFNLSEKIKASMRRKQMGVHAHLGTRLREAMVRGKPVNIDATAIISYDASELKAHFEALFTTGMTWEAFCAGEIHIDHRRPLSSFDLTNADEARAAWALSNLQPLWGPDNIAKGARWDGGSIRS